MKEEIMKLRRAEKSLRDALSVPDVPSLAAARIQDAQSCVINVRVALMKREPAE